MSGGHPPVEDAMGAIRDRMIEELRLRNRAAGTQAMYLGRVHEFVRFHRRSPDELGEAEVRAFLAHLREHRKLQPQSIGGHISALRFLYDVVLRRPEVMAHIPNPKTPKILPDVLSPAEVERLFVHIRSFPIRTLVMITYGAGLRIAEALRLRVEDIDSQRHVIHVRLGKGRKDRFVPLTDAMLFALRTYWRIERPRGPEIFAAASGHPIAAKTVRTALHRAAREARLTKRVTPHSLRHAFAAHLLELGTDIRILQLLLGHRSLETTAHYTQVSTAHLARTPSLLDRLPAARTS